MLWLSHVMAAPLAGVERLEVTDGQVCAQVKDSPVPWCWKGWAEALPRDDLRPAPPEVRLGGEPLAWPRPPRQVVALHTSVCVLDEASEVSCQGDGWRVAFGMPVTTPADRPVHVADLDGAEHLGHGGCVLRAGEVVCPSPTGTVTALTRVKTFSDDGFAIRDDGTLWTYPHPRKVLDGVAAIAPGGPNRLRNLLWQSVDGELRAGDAGVPIAGVEVGVPSSLVGGPDAGCALDPGGLVTCWGENLSGALPVEGDARLYWGPRPAKGRDRTSCRLEGRTVTCDESLTGSPAHPVVHLDDVDAFFPLGDHACARQGETLTCFGRLGDIGGTRTVFVGEEVLHDVVDAAANDYLAFALLRGGQIRMLDSAWSDLGSPVPGATRLGANEYLVCGATASELHCRDGVASAVLPLPDGPFPSDLCFAQGCLSSEPSEQVSKTPWIVQRGQP